MNDSSIREERSSSNGSGAGAGEEQPAACVTKGLASLIGERVRSRRSEAGLTQEELAQHIFVTRQSVNNWEAGRTVPDVESLKLLARTFDMSVDELLGEEADRLAEEARSERQKFSVLLLVRVFAYVLAVMLWCVGITAQVCALLVSGMAPMPDAERIQRALSEFALVLQFAFYCGVLLQSLLGVAVNSAMKRHDLRDAVDVGLYIEGVRKGRAAPDTILFQWLLPRWKTISLIAVSLLILVTLAVFAAGVWAAS